MPAPPYPPPQIRRRTTEPAPAPVEAPPMNAGVLFLIGVGFVIVIWKLIEWTLVG